MVDVHGAQQDTSGEIPEADGAVQPGGPAMADRRSGDDHHAVHEPSVALEHGQHIPCLHAEHRHGARRAHQQPLPISREHRLALHQTCAPPAHHCSVGFGPVAVFCVGDAESVRAEIATMPWNGNWSSSPFSGEEGDCGFGFRASDRV
jgi:hypothetical protein